MSGARSFALKRRYPWWYHRTSRAISVKHTINRPMDALHTAAPDPFQWISTNCTTSRDRSWAWRRGAGMLIPNFAHPCSDL